MTSIFLLLGTNLGDRLLNLDRAITCLRDQAGEVLKLSSIYETAAWGKIEQADYLNQTLELSTSIGPHDLLPVVADIEVRMGRVRKKVWGPRIIDIDILFYGDQVIHEDKLIIPHPHIQDRRFALTPLAEIAPDFVHPVLEKNIRELLDTCPDPLWVKKYTSAPQP